MSCHIVRPGVYAFMVPPPRTLQLCTTSCCCTRVRPLLSCATLHRHPLIVKCHMHVQGACCMLGGMTRMTISLCVILMETTNNIQCAHSHSSDRSSCMLLPFLVCTVCLHATMQLLVAAPLQHNACGPGVIHWAGICCRSCSRSRCQRSSGTSSTSRCAQHSQTAAGRHRTLD